MYAGKKRLSPDTPVRVEVDARIVGQVEGNPFWYEVEYASGQREVVSIARITWYSDEPRAILETNGDIVILQPRLSAAGAVNLFHWLRTNWPEIEALAGEAGGPAPQAQAESEVSPE